jgi:predicted metalloprotease with PDZ domain
VLRAFVTLFIATAAAAAPHATSPVGPLDYTITVDSARLNQYSVTLRSTWNGGPITLVMARHPEYDDRFWRFVTDLHATSNGHALAVVREDSARWRIEGAGAGRLTVEYSIAMPPVVPGVKPSWRPYVEINAAMVGGPHSFLYPTVRSSEPIRVHVAAPRGWKVATALPDTIPTSRVTPTERGFTNRDFVARDIFELTDSPILTGRLLTWTFFMDDVPHRIAYAPLPDAAAFDTAAFVGLVKRMTRGSIDVFGDMPYREFTYLFVDNAYGGLEHAASVNLGAQSATLARSVTEDAVDFAHELFHTWNLVAIHPAGRGGARENAWPLPRGLWLSEGVTMYYADVVLRRGGIETSSRADALASLIGSYLSNRGNTHVAPEVSSMYSDEPPGGTGDYAPYVHGQGQVIGTVLDLMIRDSSGWKRSLDDVMRDLYRNRTDAGFTSADVVAAVDRACACNSAPFFARHVAGSQAPDFNTAAASIGYTAEIRRDTARDGKGAAQPDAGLWGWAPGSSDVQLIIRDPEDSWGSAGLHTNDVLTSWNGTAVQTFAEFRNLLRRVKLGDDIAIGVRSNGVAHTAHVHVRPQFLTTVRLLEVANPTREQLAHRRAWLAAQ